MCCYLLQRLIHHKIASLSFHLWIALAYEQTKSVLNHVFPLNYPLLDVVAYMSVFKFRSSFKQFLMKRNFVMISFAKKWTVIWYYQIWDECFVICHYNGVSMKIFHIATTPNAYMKQHHGLCDALNSSLVLTICV